MSKRKRRRRVKEGKDEKDSHNIVRSEQTVLNSLLNSHSRPLLLLEGSKSERESSGLIARKRKKTKVSSTSSSPFSFHSSHTCPANAISPELFYLLSLSKNLVWNSPSA